MVFAQGFCGGLGKCLERHLGSSLVWLSRRRHTRCVGDLETLLSEARDKAAAESAAAELRASLNRLDSDLVELKSAREQVSRRVAKSSGLLGRFRRQQGDAHADETDLQRIGAGIDALEARRRADQRHLRTLDDEAHGAELARAMLGGEMRRRTAALRPNDPARARLAEIDERRQEAVDHRGFATAVSTLAAELILSVDGAERADDGTDVLYVELNSASRKREHLQSFLRPNALIARSMLKDRLEGFRTLDGAMHQYQSLDEIAALVAGDHVAESEVWLHRVRAALEDALESGTRDEKLTREQLIKIDNERLAILTSKS